MIYYPSHFQASLLTGKAWFRHNKTIKVGVLSLFCMANHKYKSLRLTKVIQGYLQ